MGKESIYPVETAPNFRKENERYVKKRGKGMAINIWGTEGEKKRYPYY